MSCNTAPALANPNLSNILKENCVPLILWALASPLEADFLLNKVPTINRTLQKDEKDSLRAFIYKKLSWNKDACTSLGAKEQPKDNTIFYEYLNFCKDMGYETPKPRKLRERLSSILGSIGVQVEFERMRGGFVVKGIKIDPGNTINLSPASYVDDLRVSGPFAMPITETLILKLPQ